MKILKDTLSETMSPFYRFQIFVKDSEGKKKTVGMAYLGEGQNIYTVRLWTFLGEKYFLLQSQDDQTKFFVMTREPNKSPNAKNKYFWNIVGNAKTNTSQSVLEINFDLIEKIFYLNLFPETSSTPRELAAPEVDDLAA